MLKGLVTEILKSFILSWKNTSEMKYRPYLPSIRTAMLPNSKNVTLFHIPKLFV